jgi:hypothetical protein
MAQNKIDQNAKKDKRCIDRHEDAIGTTDKLTTEGECDGKGGGDEGKYFL